MSAQHTHASEYWRLLGCYAVWLLLEPTFLMNLAPPSSGRLSSSETAVLTRATQRNNPEDAILHSHRRENLKSYITMPLCA
jgi:hypothetical protein